MRTAARVLDEIRANDPATEITLHYIRQLIHTRQVPVVEVGRKKLVDIDSILAYIAHGAPIIREVPVPGQIRRVSL
jgi:hypothetical protein